MAEAVRLSWVVLWANKSVPRCRWKLKWKKYAKLAQRLLEAYETACDPKLRNVVTAGGGDGEKAERLKQVKNDFKHLKIRQELLLNANKRRRAPADTP